MAVPWSFFIPLALREIALLPAHFGARTRLRTGSSQLLMAWAGVILAFSLLKAVRGWSITARGWPAIAMLLGLGIAHERGIGRSMVAAR